MTSQEPPRSGRGPVPAQAVLAPLSRAATFLTVTVRPGGEDVARDLLADLGGLTRSVGFREPDGHLSCVAGIGSAFWDRLVDGPRPADLHELPVLTGARHASVTTPGDLFFHLRAERADLIFELVTKIMDRLRPVADVADETVGFRFFDNRDLLGFVDGTENPVAEEAAAAVAVTGDGDFDGGSYVIVQKYLHDVAAWNALPVEEQERVIGRTKLDNVELPDPKPAGSHLAANVITDEHGDELDVLRDNMPFGAAGGGEFGTYFIAYARRPGIVERMLTNMFVGDGDVQPDRILDFSRPVTGALFYVPPLEFLDGLGG
jgi:porphyrinogen peroxidase